LKTTFEVAKPSKGLSFGSCFKIKKSKNQIRSQTIHWGSLKNEIPCLLIGLDPMISLVKWGQGSKNTVL